MSQNEKKGHGGKHTRPKKWSGARRPAEPATTALWRLSNLCNASSQRNNLIKLTHYNETNKRAHDSQIDRAEETLKVCYDVPSQRQALGTNQPMKVLHVRQDRH